MGQIHCQVTLPSKSLIAADSVVNTFSFTGVDNVEDQAVVALGKLKAFYNDVNTSGTPAALKTYFSGEINFAGARIKVYDASDPEPRVPILDESLGASAATPASASNLPAEVALCLSYAADIESGQKAARRRGRIYLGPLCTYASDGATGATARPNVNVIANMKVAAETLSDGPVGTQWCVWSRVANTYAIITHGYIDNAFDTQRRRGPDPTTRTGWTGGLG